MLHIAHHTLNALPDVPRTLLPSVDRSALQPHLSPIIRTASGNDSIPAKLRNVHPRPGLHRMRRAIDIVRQQRVPTVELARVVTDRELELAFMIADVPAAGAALVRVGTELAAGGGVRGVRHERRTASGRAAAVVQAEAVLLGDDGGRSTAGVPSDGRGSRSSAVGCGATHRLGRCGRGSDRVVGPAGAGAGHGGLREVRVSRVGAGHSWNREEGVRVAIRSREGLGDGAGVLACCDLEGRPLRVGRWSSR